MWVQQVEPNCLDRCWCRQEAALAASPPLWEGVSQPDGILFRKLVDSRGEYFISRFAAKQKHAVGLSDAKNLLGPEVWDGSVAGANGFPGWRNSGGPVLHFKVTTRLSRINEI